MVAIKQIQKVKCIHGQFEILQQPDKCRWTQRILSFKKVLFRYFQDNNSTFVGLGIYSQFHHMFTQMNFDHFHCTQNPSISIEFKYLMFSWLDAGLVFWMESELVARVIRSEAEKDPKTNYIDFRQFRSTNFLIRSQKEEINLNGKLNNEILYGFLTTY
jgi:hypothetical protein